MTKRRTALELLVVGLSAFVANAIMAYLVVFRLNLFLTDAMARTRSAWQVFFSGEPKLANVGFVWAPLPTLLQLPFVLIPPLRYKGLSGNLVTVLAGAASAMLVALFLRRTKLPALLRWLMVAAFVLNPMVIFYSSNGMSEMVVILFVLAATYLYIRWHETGLWTYLAGAGAATGAAFLARYDALFVAVALTMAIGLEALVRRPDRPRFSESSVLMFGAPVAYIVALWIASNWAIMGDPLFFARSIYSNAGQIGYQLTIYTNLVPLKGNLVARRMALAGSAGYRVVSDSVLGGERICRAVGPVSALLHHGHPHGVRAGRRHPSAIRSMANSSGSCLACRPGCLRLQFGPGDAPAHRMGAVE
ncbi:MAG: glycosyltransferase family 39 protein [Chloroflexi bacterium]|nr:glycosyltransferase family 39 protein [Chloroflexota bacterium]